MSAPEIGDPRLFEPPAPTTLTLQDRFLVPPFSTLDSRAGYWQERKRQWLRIGLRSEIGRGDDMLDLTGTAGRKARYEQEARAREVALLERDGMLATAVPDGNGKSQLSTGTSIFDPVLCELIYRWFSPEGGIVLDPFAGGSVRGIIAGVMGRDYLGIDLSAEQIAANEEQRTELSARLLRPPRWIVGDSRELDSHVPADAQYDLVFTCPPYFDLEVYSDDPRDLSTANDYEVFRSAYEEIIVRACDRLRPDRYAAIVVSEVRSKRDGSYVGLVPDTHRAFEAAGMRLYNEAILLNSVGTLALRVSRSFGAGRKLGRSHQNVLVYVKGDGRRAADACGMVDEVAVEQGGATWRADAHVTYAEDDLDLGGL